MAGFRTLRLSERRGKFVREVGSVVLGVVIALALGEWVESYNWSVRRGEAKEALRFELSGAVGSAVERKMMAQCLRNRLDEIAAVIDKGAATGRLPAVRNLQPPPARPWTSTAWETVVASETAARFPVRTLNNLAFAYETIDQMRDWNVDEKTAWTSLSLLEGEGRAFTRSSKFTSATAMQRQPITRAS